MSRKPKRKPVEAWAWAVAAAKSDTFIFFDRSEALDEMHDLNADDPTAAAEVIDLVPRAEADPLTEAVVKAAKAWAKVADDAPSLAQDLMTDDLRAAVERLEKRK